MSGADSSATFCRALDVALKRRGFTATWLNHYTALNADWDALAGVDFVGIDGTLLQILLARRGISVQRTSADLALPVFLGQHSQRTARLALVGGAPGVAERAGERLPQDLVFVRDGFGGLKALLESPAPLIKAAPQIVLVGVGAGLQDRVAVQIGRWLPEASVFTVGGWLDQLAAKPQYFPPWVHRMRLGWLWRLIHEPKRLIRRYTVDAVRALNARKSLCERLSEREVRAGVLLETVACKN
jgi:exopolysaccharide biosynthesis WecB/TagA/CpsF family protein